ncbi:MAG TPA: alanine--tRNA ligase [Solirubrobacteraceae bacterium]|jgi:alanyl-tRNA synthetase|nr:alanine--tRNA ligase [Solirubrobacteraceae bacterium]
MTSDEIRRAFLEYFESQDHLRLPSASLVPSELDPSALFTIAGMHPLKAYFAGIEPPPHPRVTTCQKTFRTGDIEIIGTTTRHLTFFEMLGNFSFGDYFKREATRFAWALSTEGFGFNPDDIWITVFAGDEELGLGPDQEAIDAWLEIGIPRERIVECPRSENFWQSGPLGPCGPCSELYLDRGVERGSIDDLPGGENERFLEYWNLVFMEMDQNPTNVLTPLPAKNIDTGLGLNRLACILQGKATVFETDQFAPLIELGEEMSGRRYGEGFATDRALRVLADHGRSMTFLLGDGVVPSNEDRGYVLRRIMRRAIQHGRGLGLEPGFLLRYADVVTELMGAEYPELGARGDTIRRWMAAEEESFGRTLEQGLKRLDELMARARENDDEGIAASDAFLLHDTYGFPIDLTLEIVAEHGLGVDEEGFESLMEDQRTRAREGSRGERAGDGLREKAAALSGRAGFATEFVGYETTDAETTIGAAVSDNGDVLIKLVESPFYATGGGQVADAGVLECETGTCRAAVTDVIRLGTDQVIRIAPEHGTFEPGERVRAHVDRAARHATACNHTATHLLHASLRQRLGTHVHQAGSYVGPDKLRFDFTHASSLSPQELRLVEDDVNRWIVESHPVRALSTSLDEAKRLGAMALFNEKYGEVVRMVEVGDGGDGGGGPELVSRELCGGTHVHNTAEAGLFRIVTETSSAANVRRIEAITGPEAIALYRERDRELSAVAETLRVPTGRVVDSVQKLTERVRELERAAKRGGAGNGAVDIDKLIASATRSDGASVLTEMVEVPDGQALLELADRLKGKLGDAAIVLGTAGEGRVDLVASVAPALVARGVRAGEIIKVAAAEVGGGGGGRDTMARAGGKDPAQLPAAINAARTAIEAALNS